ncbi:unnamed protein product, partial [Mycena citricolor]
MKCNPPLLKQRAHSAMIPTSSNYPPPVFALARRRTPMACTNCRKRKIKCLVKEDQPLKTCERCTKRKLHCEYRPVLEEALLVDESESIGSPDSTTSEAEF